MRPLTLELENWMPFAKEKVDFGNVHVAALTGENGAGKSSILDAITWALWGKARGDSDEDRIRAGAQQCTVKLDFEVNGRRFKVVRTKKRGKGKASGQSTLTLFDDQQDITGATIKETQAAIIDLIKMDYQTFCNSVFLRQGHSDEFTIADPADRKRVLINILALDQYDALEVKAKDVLRDIEDSLLEENAKSGQLIAEAIRLEGCILLLQDAQARLDPIAKAILKHEAIVTDLEAQAAQLQPKREELTRLRRDGQKLADNLQNAERQKGTHTALVTQYAKVIENKVATLKGYEDLKKAEASRDGLSIKAREAGQVNEKRGKLALTISQAEGKLKSDLSKADAIVLQLSSSKPNHCPTCGQTMNPEKQAEIADKLSKARAARGGIALQLEKQGFALAERQELAQLDVKAASLGEELKDWDKVQADVKRLTPYRQAKNALDQAEANLEKESGYLKEAEVAVKDAGEAVRASNLRYEELTTALSGAEEIDRKWKIARTDLSNARSENGVAQKAVADMTAQVDFARKCQEQAQDIEARLQELQRQADVYKFLAGAFNKAGIPSEIIKAAVPELEAEANKFLSEMTEGRMSLALLTQRDNRSGTTTETLDILISDELGTRAYEMYSGGEAFKVNLALRLALSKMVARRAGAPTSCLFIDEGFGTQDQNGLTKVIEALHSVEDKFNLVLVITHLDELKEEFGTQIRVTKDGTGSKVAVLN